MTRPAFRAIGALTFALVLTGCERPEPSRDYYADLELVRARAMAAEMQVKLWQCEDARERAHATKRKRKP